MKKLNINRDKPDLTDEQILKHKNFDAVMNSVAATKIPWYKTGKFWMLGGGAIVVITTVIVLSDFGVNKPTEPVRQELTVIKPNLDTNVEVIDDVVEQEEFSFVEFQIGASSVIHTSLGASIELPASVYGEISGIETNKYTARITELPIPNNIELDPEAKKESFQLDLFIADEKAAIFGSDGIKMTKENVSLWKYENENWVPVEEFESISLEQNSTTDSTTSMLEPIKKTTRTFTFDASYGLEEQTKEFSELSGYKNIIFEPLEPQKDAFYNAEWSEVSIEKLTVGKYRLHLKLFDVEKTCDVRVVFDGESFDEAMNLYKESFIKSEQEFIKSESYMYLQNGGKYLAVYL